MKIGSGARGGETKPLKGEKDLTDCSFLGFLKLRDFWEGGADVMKVPARPLPEPSKAGGGRSTSTSALSSSGPFEVLGGACLHCPTPWLSRDQGGGTPVHAQIYSTKAHIRDMQGVSMRMKFYWKIEVILNQKCSGDMIKFWKVVII